MDSEFPYAGYDQTKAVCIGPVVRKPDTQDRKEFVTGAVRSKDCEAVRYDLISPIALKAWGEAYAEGSVKYGDYNCEKGFPISDLLNHAIEHIRKYLAGDRSEDHLGHLIWNAGMAKHSEVLWPHLNTNLRTEGCKPPA